MFDQSWLATPPLRDACLGRFPSSVGDHSCLKKVSDQLQNTSIADLIADQVNKPILVDTVKGSGDRLPIAGIFPIR